MNALATRLDLDRKLARLLADAILKELRQEQGGDTRQPSPPRPRPEAA